MSYAVEIAFLPAALEIQETPPSPAGRTILWSIVVFFVGALLWANFGQVDIVAVAQGRIIPSGHSKVVQPLEIGTVKSIHTTEGQTVRAGEVLIELDSSSAQADVAQLSEERDAAQREVWRLKTLVTRLADAAQTTSDPIANQSDRATGDPLLTSQWLEFTNRLNLLARERDRRVAERRSAQSQVNRFTAVLPIVTRRAEDQKGLAQKKLLPEQHYLETEQERLSLFHDLQTQQGRVAELDAAIGELEARWTLTRSEFKREVLEQLEQAERREVAAVQQLIKANTRANAQTILAPVDGVVQQLAVHNIGAVVTPAQVLMVIVPQGETLEVEAVLENKDIGFVDVGQAAEIKIDAFPFTKYGTLTGEILDLSDDAVADEQRGLVYKLRASMDRSEMLVNGKAVALSPGMTVTVESKTGTRRLIEYFLSPLLRYKDESVRER